MDPLRFDPRDPEFPEAANSVFAMMRSQQPALRHGSQAWPFISIFRYDDIRRALVDWETWSSEMPVVRDLILGDASIMIQDDPPAHTQYRALLKPYMSTKAMAQMGVDVPILAEIQLAPRIGEAIDFVEEVAAQIALNVVCKIIGLPDSESTYLRDWTNRLADAVGLEFVETDQNKLNEQKQRVQLLHEELTGFFRLLVRSAGVSRGAGLIAASAEWPLRNVSTSLRHRLGGV